MMDMTTPLQTRRLLLRPFSLDDAPQAFRIFSDPVVNTFLPWYPVETLAETQAFLKERWLPTQQAGACRYAICLAESGQLIGYIQITPGESHDLGLWTGPGALGKRICRRSGQGLASGGPANGFAFSHCHPRQEKPGQRPGDGKAGHDLSLFL